ncbi:MAG: YkgJ family cysteine cluster protein [bacterium]|nr:YkgJ family cysteine cluster protein [bacterium]
MHYWWERDGVRFACAACGRCCGGEPGSIWVTPGEREKIARELGIDELTLRKEYLTRREGRCSIKERENYDCIFLGLNSRRCEIYKVRPLQCRLFPFWPSMLRDKKIWNYYADYCPGMNNGKHYSPEILRRFLILPGAEFL